MAWWSSATTSAVGNILAAGRLGGRERDVMSRGLLAMPGWVARQERPRLRSPAGRTKLWRSMRLNRPGVACRRASRLPGSPKIKDKAWLLTL